MGFGFGDAVIMELLESKGLAPRVATANSVQVVVVALGDASRAVAIKCTAALRAPNFFLSSVSFLKTAFLHSFGGSIF